MTVENEKAIRAVVAMAVKSYASGFSDRHLAEVDDEDGTINMKIHNVFIAALGAEIQYYSALARSLDSSLGNMLEAYKNTKGANHKKPRVSDYVGISGKKTATSGHSKRHERDYYLYDKETGMHYLIELKIGGDLDNKKARSEKEALLEQYCILANSLGSEEKVKICFATAYNRYGEGNPWTQGRVLQFFAEDELLISSKFWNMVCKSDQGYEIVLDEYRKNAHYIIEALAKIKKAYLPESND